MLYTPQSRQLAITLSEYRPAVIAMVAHWFDVALDNSMGEVPFVRELVKVSNGKTHSAGNVLIDVQSTMLHQKPYVVFEMNGKKDRCELADLLVIVTYQNGTTVVERKSIFYQVKVQKADTQRTHGAWKIQANQQYCLANFPEMWPGRKADPKPTNTWNVTPRTLDFGCFMLLTYDKDVYQWRRRPYHADDMFAPSATALTNLVNSTWKSSSKAYPGILRFSDHILFKVGEPHSIEVDKFVSAVIAEAGGGAFQPPTTCHISKNYDGTGRPIYDSLPTEEGNFGIIRITVSLS